MKLATWNVNSMKARLPRVLEFLDRHHPDVLCVQETKSTPEAFPHHELAGAGYVAADHSRGRWAGVAILTPRERAPSEVHIGLPSEPLPDEARWIEATVDGVRVVSVYVINGRTREDPMFEKKLDFIDAMIERAGSFEGTPLVIAGDFNIAPADGDVYDPAAFVGTTHTSEVERNRLSRLLDTGLVDAYRHLHPDTTQFTWWDYRAGHFHRGLGLRIDLALVSRGLAETMVSAGIDRDFRKGPKPSDHAPFMIEFAAPPN